jgi:hypothetical protein
VHVCEIQIVVAAAWLSLDCWHAMLDEMACALDGMACAHGDGLLQEVLLHSTLCTCALIVDIVVYLGSPIL